MDLVPSAPGSGQTFTGILVSGATIVNSSISGSTFVGGTISGSTLLNTTISGATLFASTLTGATILGGTISGTTFAAGTISSGVTMSPYSASARQFVHVNRNSVDQSINSGTDTKIQYTTEVFDADGVFDNATNYRMTPTKSGKFLVIGACVISNMNDNEHIESQIWKNGSMVAYTRASIAGTGIDRSVIASAIVDMNGSTDYLEHYVEHNHGSARNLYGGTTSTYFQAMWISA